MLTFSWKNKKTTNNSSQRIDPDKCRLQVRHITVEVNFLRLDVMSFSWMLNDNIFTTDVATFRLRFEKDYERGV
jgi:hypothetical protein